MDAYDEGWIVGYYDEATENPYPELTEEHTTWEEGNRQGQADC